LIENYITTTNKINTQLQYVNISTDLTEFLDNSRFRIEIFLNSYQSYIIVSLVMDNYVTIIYRETKYCNFINNKEYANDYKTR